jgi:hypothetical protein
MHAVLHLQTNRPIAEYDQTFEERLCETSARSLLVHDNWTKLLMIADEDNLLTPKHQRDHTFWLSSLRSLVDQHRPELEFVETRITSTHASAADNIRSTQNFLLALPDQRLVLPLIVAVV